MSDMKTELSARRERLANLAASAEVPLAKVTGVLLALLREEGNADERRFANSITRRQLDILGDASHVERG